MNFLESFIKATEEMREAQKAYFKNRTQDNLVDAKQKESAVDGLIHQYRNPQMFPGCETV